MYNAPVSPQTIGGVLDSGFRLFKASIGSTFLLAFIAALAIAPVNRASRFVQVDVPDAGTAGALMAGVLIALVVSVVLYGAIIARIAGVAQGSAVSIRDALGTGLRRGPALFGAYFCYMLAVLVGLILLIIPGLYLMVLLVFGAFVAVTERKGPIESLLYGRQLVRGHWWRTAGILTIIGIVLFALTMLLSLVSTVPIILNPNALLEPGVFPWYVDYLVSPLLSGLFTPLWCALFLAVLADLKLRHEGGDIAVRIAATA